jgi:hypothetical protein
MESPQMMTGQRLSQENDTFRNTDGVSERNRSHGFRPAFLDTETGCIYPSCYTSGIQAPVHLLDGLPNHVVVARDISGRIIAAKHSLVSGFVINDRFFTRAEAVEQLAGCE